MTAGQVHVRDGAASGGWIGASGPVVRGALAGLRRRVARLAALLVLSSVAVGIGGCATSEYDPTANWTADQLYVDAKSELSSGNWGAAVKALQKLESRYPFGRYAQQAQLELAWASYKEGERAGAGRRRPLHPPASDPRRLDYAFYLKGLINFNNRRDCSRAWRARICRSATSRRRATRTNRSSS